MLSFQRREFVYATTRMQRRPIADDPDGRGPSILTTSCLGERRPLWDLILWQARSGFHPTAEVEEGNQGRNLPDITFVPAGLPQRPDVALAYHARRLCELAGITEQSSGLGIQLVLRPGGREFMAKLLIAREAANCRRVEPQSGCAAHLTVDDGGQHLTLEATDG